MKDLKGKSILITGATSGIGRECAVAAGRVGARLVLTGRRQAEGDATVEAVQAAGGEAVFLQSDVSDESQVEAAVAATVEHYGRIDGAFNNAGVEGELGPVTEQTLENYRLVYDINVGGVLMSLKHEIKAMREKGHGAIVNNASIAAMIGMPGGSVYFGSKHAVLGMTKCAALETAEENIRVNAVSPAVIETDMADRFFGGDFETAASIHPMNRLGQPIEIANAVLFLLSEQSGFITGANLPVDGGYTAR